MNYSAIAASIVVTAFISHGALAHHASNLDYDEDRVGTIEGVVQDIFWSNPHIHFYLTVTNEAGAKETWDMEGPNLSSLSRRSVSRDSVQLGDTIAITGLAETVTNESGHIRS
jgi:hypothetical protein